MAELEISGTPEEQMGVIKVTLKRHEAVLFGNGQKGFVPEVRAFMAEWRGAERERSAEMKRRDKKTNFRLAIIGLIVTLLVGLMELFGPSIRKDMGLIEAQIVEMCSRRAPVIDSRQDVPVNASLH